MLSKTAWGRSLQDMLDGLTDRPHFRGQKPTCLTSVASSSRNAAIAASRVAACSKSRSTSMTFRPAGRGLHNAANGNAPRQGRCPHFPRFRTLALLGRRAVTAHGSNRHARRPRNLAQTETSGDRRPSGYKPDELPGCSVVSRASSTSCL
jgi:hypothetical protein